MLCQLKLKANTCTSRGVRRLRVRCGLETGQTVAPQTHSLCSISFDRRRQHTLTTSPLQLRPPSYPGVHTELRDYINGIYAVGAHNSSADIRSSLLPINEIFMMAVMDKLTDKPDWHKKVFDDRTVAKWRKEAMQQPEDDLFARIVEVKLAQFRGIESRDSKRHPVNYSVSLEPTKPQGRILSEACFDFCIKELRCKAAYYEKTGLVPALDSDGNSVVKSDSLFDQGLQADARVAFEKLQAEQSGNVDWHPGSKDMVQDLVHPSMYPFVYDCTPFIEAEAVGICNAMSFIGQGRPVSVKTSGPSPATDTFYGTDLPELWSDQYQWLPANVAVDIDGKVHFTSYINNLHPNKHPEVYEMIEKLVDRAIPAWDQCLIKTGFQETDFGVSAHCYGSPKSSGRQHSRFRMPDKCSIHDSELWEPFNADILKENDFETDDETIHDAISHRYESVPDYYKKRPWCDKAGRYVDPEPTHEEVQRWKFRLIADPILPQPEEWREIDYAACERLIERYRDTGLQIIVKMASIELTPDKPLFQSGNWHIEGLLSERIVATALYYVDGKNVIPSYLDFRMPTDNDQDQLAQIAPQDDWVYLNRVYGTEFRSEEDVCHQYYGRVETKPGRMVAFPNVFQHRVSSFKLRDPTKPGHRRIIALWLVDPHRRIISTANVPPQRHDWAREYMASRCDHGQAPAERRGIMSEDEAKQHRERLMAERSRTVEANLSSVVSGGTYDFCEH